MTGIFEEIWLGNRFALLGTDLRFMLLTSLHHAILANVTCSGGPVKQARSLRIKPVLSNLCIQMEKVVL